MRKTLTPFCFLGTGLLHAGGSLLCDPPYQSPIVRRDWFWEITNA